MDHAELHRFVPTVLEEHCAGRWSELRTERRQPRSKLGLGGVGQRHDRTHSGGESRAAIPLVPRRPGACPTPERRPSRSCRSS